MTLDPAAATTYVDKAWASHIADTLDDFIRIPNLSPDYDPGWAEAGHMARAVDLIRSWCEHQVETGLLDATIEVQELSGRTPLLLVDVPPTDAGSADTGSADGGSADGAKPDAAKPDTVVLYGHLDKQPPFDGWRDGLGPWEPVVENDRLYGRGGADDGYAVFAALTAIAANRAAGGAHARCLVLIEASEESGSPDLTAHLEALGDRLGNPSLVVALDSGCEGWDNLWVTTSLRGLVNVTLTVEMLREGVHSGDAGNVVPSTFRILRRLLDRIEDAATGILIVPELHTEVPELRRQQAADAAEDSGSPAGQFPFLTGTQPVEGSPLDLLVARWWAPALEIIGLEGAPPPASAGNVLRPSTTAKLSFRLPPTVDAATAAAAVVQRLTEDPPYGARITATVGTAESGWHAPIEPEWLSTALDSASRSSFGAPARARGEGGSIPFMGLLGRTFPEAQFVVTGVLGPGSNAHGPNEFLDLPTARNLTAALAHLLDAHARR